MRPKEIMLYKCPKCEGYLELTTKSIFKINPYDWKCVECKKTFRISIREVRLLLKW